MKLARVLFLLTLSAQCAAATREMNFEPAWYFYQEVRLPKGLQPKSVRTEFGEKHIKAKAGFDSCDNQQSEFHIRTEGEAKIISFAFPRTPGESAISRASVVDLGEPLAFVFDLPFDLKHADPNSIWTGWQKPVYLEDAGEACMLFIDGKSSSKRKNQSSNEGPQLRYRLRRFPGGSSAQRDKWFADQENDKAKAK